MPEFYKEKRRHEILRIRASILVQTFRTISSKNSFIYFAMFNVEFKRPKNFREFQKLIAENKKVVVNFYATWCGPCWMIERKFQKFAGDHPDLVYVKVDVDDAGDIPSEVGIRAMPTFLFYKDGQKQDEIRGASVKTLEETIQSLAQLA